MVKDVYAIYEQYLAENYNDSSTELPGNKATKRYSPLMTANNSSRSILPNGNKGVQGAFGDKATVSNLSPSGSEANETPIQRKIKKDINKLHELVSSGKYEDAVVYCHSINKALQDAHNSKK